MLERWGGVGGLDEYLNEFVTCDRGQIHDIVAIVQMINKTFIYT